nr:hypothetical protein [Tanacetum cinerariifolium]
MSSLFADTHNVVAILEKSDAIEGFDQIIDFLSGSYIYYALTVNPHIYISCIKQFWNTASVKRSGDVTRLQALVDKKKIVISKAVIREILQLNDAEGVNQVGDLSTHTTRFISLALTQKVFANMRRVGKGFSGVETPLFEGMLAVGQSVEEGLVAEQVQVDDVVATFVEENVAEDLVIIKLKARVKRLEKANMVKSLKLRRLRKVGASRRLESSDDMEDVFNQGRMIDDMDMNEGIELVKDADIVESKGRHAEKQAEIYNLDLDHSSKILSMQEDDSEVQEVVEVVTTDKLITKVVTAAASQVSATSTTIHAASATIPAAKPTIPAAAPIVVVAYTRRRKGVIIRDPEEELSLKTPGETPKVKDKGKGILVETPKPMKKKDQMELDAEYAKKLQEEINKDYEEFSKDIDWDAVMDHNTAGYKMDFFKGMIYAQICPIFQARFDENMRFLFKSREEMEEEDHEIIKSINETPAQKAAKRKKLSEEAQEVEDLRKRLEVVEEEDDDLLELMLSKRSKKNTKCVNAVSEELTAAKHKLITTTWHQRLGHPGEEASCHVTRRSTSGYCVFLGDNRLSWFAKRHVTLSHSNAKVEYRKVTNVVAEVAWIYNLLREFHTPLFIATLVYYDNVRVLHVPSRYQYADIFTKGLPTALFKEFHTSLSV